MFLSKEQQKLLLALGVVLLLKKVGTEEKTPHPTCTMFKLSERRRS
jgi:hypothetical protein